MHSHSAKGQASWMAMMVLFGAFWTTAAGAQSLDLEGRTGGIVTPFAYTLESGRLGISPPSAAFHLIGGGDVVGTHFQVSVTEGFLGRVEVGYTRSAVSEGSSQPLSNLFDRGFSIVHGKVLLVPEGSGMVSLPAVSAGFVARYQRKHIEGGIGSATKNEDFYAVATKTLGGIEPVHLIVSGGLKATDASILGFAGNSPDWAWCGFAFAGVKLAGQVLVGAEYAQQPEEIKGVGEADVPGTVTVFARLTPALLGRLSIDAGMISLGDEIGGDLDVDVYQGDGTAGRLDIEASSRYFLGAGYRF